MRYENIAINSDSKLSRYTLPTGCLYSDFNVCFVIFQIEIPMAMTKLAPAQAGVEGGIDHRLSNMFLSMCSHLPFPLVCFVVRLFVFPRGT